METRPTGCLATCVIIVDLRVKGTLQPGAVRNPPLPFSRLVGTVSNSADAVRLETAPTGGESVYLFLEFTIVFCFGSCPRFVVAQFIACSYAS